MNGEQKTIINKGSRQKALQEKSYKKERNTQKNLDIIDNEIKVLSNAFYPT